MMMKLNRAIIEYLKSISKEPLHYVIYNNKDELIRLTGFVGKHCFCGCSTYNHFYNHFDPIISCAECGSLVKPKWIHNVNMSKIKNAHVTVVPIYKLRLNIKKYFYIKIKGYIENGIFNYCTGITRRF